MSKLQVIVPGTVLLLIMGLTGMEQLASDQRLAGRAARSVHLGYPAPDGTLFYNEIIVEESQTGSYFCVNGFRHGYFGIQERWQDKVVIFSIWDPGQQNNPDEVSQERRVKLLYQGEGVQVKRFGGEGTGGQSFFPYEWEIGQTYKFLVKATVTGDRTAYAGYFYLNQEKQWKHLVTFETLTGGDYLKGYYSFVEDFRRDGKSLKERRVARYGNGWVKTTEGDWIALTKARFTGDSNPATNINAGVKDNLFFLATGGDIKNEIPLRTLIKRPPADLVLPQE